MTTALAWRSLLTSQEYLLINLHINLFCKLCYYNICCIPYNYAVFHAFVQIFMCLDGWRKTFHDAEIWKYSACVFRYLSPVRLLVYFFLNSFSSYVELYCTFTDLLSLSLTKFTIYMVRDRTNMSEHQNLQNSLDMFYGRL